MKFSSMSKAKKIIQYELFHNISFDMVYFTRVVSSNLYSVTHFSTEIILLNWLTKKELQAYEYI